MTKLISRTPIRALVVDDEALANSHVQLQLEQLGYEVVGNAYDGPEAVRLTERLRPDVVVMDLHMVNPETGEEERIAGLKATREIQQRCPTPVVVVTAYEAQDLVKQASIIGVGAYLVKPTRENDLERAITIALARFRDFMELQRLNTELARYNAELDAFASTVAQGLKVPLNTIIADTETLFQHYPDCPRPMVLEQVRGITQRSYTIHNISKELLLLARLRRVGDIEIQALKMGDIVRRASNRLQGLPDWRDVEIMLPAQWPIAEGQESWVEEMWISYLSNAIKHGLPEQPPFRIEVGADLLEHNMIRFWVRDFGSGIPLDRQEAIFAPPPQDLPVRGEGLSLNLVQYLAQKMGGQAGVISPAPVTAAEMEPVGGCLFYFTLPEAAAIYCEP